jgi:3'(2'), 5'-bisphosphate nucleotidase
MIAEGRAQIYYRHGHTSEWDVAAGYAISKYAGAEISGLTFNKKDILNNSFLIKSII